MGTLGAHKFIDERALRGFLLTCQSEVINSFFFLLHRLDLLLHSSRVKSSIIYI